MTVPLFQMGDAGDVSDGGCWRRLITLALIDCSFVSDGGRGRGRRRRERREERRKRKSSCRRSEKVETRRIGARRKHQRKTSEPFIHSFIHSLISSFIHSFKQTFIHSNIHSFIHSNIHTFYSFEIETERGSFGPFTFIHFQNDEIEGRA